MTCETVGLFGPYSKDYLQIAQIIAVTLVAGVGAWIAFQQMSIARNKLKFDLFEKRFRVFQATGRFLETIWREEDMRDDREFYASTRDAEFLFDDKLAKYIAELLNNGHELRKINEQLRNEPQQSDHAELSSEKTGHLIWFYKHWIELSSRFRPFMNIHQ